MKKRISSSLPFAENIKRLRTGRRFTLAFLASKAGMSKSYLSQIENKTVSNPTIGTLEKIADALDVRIGRILEHPSVLTIAYTESPNLELSSGRAERLLAELEGILKTEAMNAESKALLCDILDILVAALKRQLTREEIDFR